MRRTKRQRATAASLQRTVDRWNAQHPVSTAVIVRRDSGELQLTSTRSAAWVMSGHSAVILLNGISGCYHLDRVTPANLARIDGPDAARPAA
ncbi:hypothetical protein [Vineibacter terrae]|uniref:hypothetical protein n=1 Tax=Vineibacter terrae TaxID=2586908 RepID=UPI002E2F8896|nr:hypothetical protein [Vineibacter terrae]HEX2886799.1 hypothetical protein [Vineibacter terrae]